MNLFTLALAALPVLAATLAAAQPSGPVPDGIEPVVANLVAAWNKGDADAFAARYAPDGSFTNIVGMSAIGREGFIKQHQLIFTTIYQGSHVDLSIAHVALVRPDVAIVDVDSRLSGFHRLPPGMMAFPDGALHTRLQMTMTHEQDGWWIHSFHNVVIYPMPPGGPAGPGGPPPASAPPKP